MKALAAIFLAISATDLPLPLWARIASLVCFAVVTFILGINYLRRNYEITVQGL